jgi:hypothetical protein
MIRKVGFRSEINKHHKNWQNIRLRFIMSYLLLENILLADKGLKKQVFIYSALKDLHGNVYQTAAQDLRSVYTSVINDEYESFQL